MNKNTDIFTARNAFFASLFLAASILAFLAPKAAVNVDEQLHYPHAKKVVNWYFTGGEDASCLDTPVSNLKYYGQSVDNFTALVNRVFNIKNEFRTRHYTGAVFFWMLLLFSGLIAFQLSGSFWISVITVISIMLMPRVFGHAFGNLKDIPFAAGYLAGVYFIIRLLMQLPKVKWTTVIYLGIAIAFTNSVRIGGLILFAYLGVGVLFTLILKPFLLKHIVSTKSCFVRLTGQGLVIAVIGYFAGLLFWPFALQNVFQHPIESLKLMEHYKVSIRQIFDGQLLWSTQLPWYYLPKWILISTPGFILLGLLLRIISFFRYKLKPIKRKQLYLELFVFFTLVFPLIYVLIIKSNLYSGIRQLVFVLPLLAVFASIGIVEFVKSISKKSIRISMIASFVFFMFLPFKHQAKTFPADYIYFNSLSGGNKNAWGKYEYDYYFHGIKEASEYLTELLGDKNYTVASNCNLSNYFDVENIQFQYVKYLERSEVDWDYGVFGINYIPPEMIQNGKWYSAETIKTFFHHGNPIAVVLKRNKTDFVGIKQLNAGNKEVAKTLLTESVRLDPNNIWLLVQLAKLALEQNDSESFKQCLNSARNIYSDYEPLYLLEAQYLYLQQDFEGASAVLENLQSVNIRYKNAAPLLKAIKQKTEF